jgi:hypothetical protein
VLFVGSADAVYGTRVQPTRHTGGRDPNGSAAFFRFREEAVIDIDELTAEEGELLVRIAGIIKSIESGMVILKLHEGHVTQLETAETIVLT